MIEYYYDTFGRSTGYAINGVRQTTIDYDSFGRISTMTVPATENGENVHSPTPTQSSNSFHWTYLQGSDLKASLAYPNGLTASWTYDANNQLLQVKNTYPSDGLGRDGSPLPSAGVISQFDYTYDAAGRRTAITRSGSAFGDLSGSVDTYTYNARSELTSARRTKNGQPIPGFSEDFDYDPIGNRRSSATYNEKGEAQTSTYQANNLNQYTSRTTPGYAAVRGEAAPEATVTVNENPAFRLGSYYFGSDLFDNSTAGGLANLETYATLGQFAANGEEADDLVSATTNQVYLAQSPDTFAYDDDGNQTLITTKTGLWRVTYNGENRPIRWERDSDTKTLMMAYDHMGRRRAKNAQRFFYDGYLQVADDTGNSYTWDCTETIATRPLAWTRYPDAVEQSGDGSASQIFFYTHDGNKNVSEVIAADGTLAAHYEYAPFGVLTVSRGTSAAANPWRFSSEHAEDDTATVYYNYRHYESMMGRWTEKDPSEGLKLFKHDEVAASDRSQDGLLEYLFVANSLCCDYLGLVKFDSNCKGVGTACSTEVSNLSQKLATYIGNQPQNKRNRSDAYARIKKRLESLGFKLTQWSNSEDMGRAIEKIKNDLDGSSQEINCCPPADLGVCDGKTAAAYVRRCNVDPQWKGRIVLCKRGLNGMDDFGGCGCILLHELLHKWGFSTSQASLGASKGSGDVENAMIYIARELFKSDCNGNDVWD